MQKHPLTGEQEQPKKHAKLKTITSFDSDLYELEDLAAESDRVVCDQGLLVDFRPWNYSYRRS